MSQSKTFQKKGLEFLEKLLFEIFEFENQSHLDIVLASNALDYRKCWLSNNGFLVRDYSREFDELLIDNKEISKTR